MKARTLRRVFDFWPPFLASGIRVPVLADDWRHARVEPRPRWYNRNYDGTHFGGNKHLHSFETAITDTAGDTVALVRKQLHVRQMRAR